MGRTPLNHLDDVTPDTRAEQDWDGIDSVRAQRDAAEAALVRLRSELEQLAKGWIDRSDRSSIKLRSAAFMKCADDVFAALARGGE